MKRFPAILGLLLVSLFIGALICYPTGLAAAEQKRPQQIATVQNWAAPFGTGNYLHANALGDLSRKFHPWLRVQATETPGFVWNIQQISRHPELWEKVVLQSCLNMTWMAAKPLPPFKEKVVGFRCLANWIVAGMCLVTLNPDIKSIGDLAGKKVGLGLMSQNNYGYFPRMIIVEGWGLEPKKDVKIEMVGLRAATDALLDGKIDVSINAVYPPLKPGGKTSPGPALLKLLGTGKPVYFVDMGKEQIEKLAKEKGAPIFPITIRAGSLEGLKSDFVTMGTDAGHWCKDAFPDHLAYEFTKFYWENCPKIGDYYAGGKRCTREMATTAVPKERYHPAAIRFYEEVGAVWKK